MYCQVIADRSVNETIDFYDMGWVRQEFTGLHNPGQPFSHAKKDIPCPKSFDKMKEIARILTRGIHFLRIDEYEINGHPYFGEITFFPASGFGEFAPEEWNYKLGSGITLPDKN